MLPTIPCSPVKFPVSWRRELAQRALHYSGLWPVVGSPSRQNCRNPCKLTCSQGIGLETGAISTASPVREVMFELPNSQKKKSGYLWCKDCTSVRGYAYKRSHLVALRPNKITASSPQRRPGGRASDKNRNGQMTKLIITGLHHDTTRKRSFVYVRWEDDPEKNLGLMVPFGCSLDNARERFRFNHAIWLDGEVEFETSDGEVRRVTAGKAVLVEDTHGKGHISRHPPEGQNLILVMLPDGLDQRFD